MLHEALSGASTWIFAGHGDMLLGGEAVLGFMDEATGHMQAVSVEALVATIRTHVLHGKLKLVALCGCCTLELAIALRERAFVPYVLCWESRLLDDAAAVFDVSFAQASATGHDPQRAFESACLAVATVTEPGWLDTGEESVVQKYQLHEDPMEFEKVHPIFPVGPHSGRMRSHAPLARRGRLAVGKPRLLLPDETRLHGVPALPTHCIRRPEQINLRTALVGDSSPAAAVALRAARLGGGGGGGGSSFSNGSSLSGTPRLSDRDNSLRDGGGGGGIRQLFAGLCGVAGLGKTTLACWLCRDVVVRTAFRDGIFWIECGRGRAGLDGLTHLARLLGVSSHDQQAWWGWLDATDLSDEVANRLRGLHCLIVLDDVWHESQLQPL